MLRKIGKNRNLTPCKITNFDSDFDGHGHGDVPTGKTTVLEKVTTQRV